MYYKSGTGRHYCIGAGQMLHVYSPDGSTFLHEITPWPHANIIKSYRKSDSVN